MTTIRKSSSKLTSQAQAQAQKLKHRSSAMGEVIKSLHAFAILSFITALLSESSALFEAGGNDANEQQASTSVPRPDPSGRPQLMVAIYCGSQSASDGRSAASLYHNQYLDVETRKWRSDRDASAYCTHDKQAILNYCKKVYPEHDIRNIVESSRPYKIDNWCRLGSSKRRCRSRLITRPYRCLEGAFQSDALLVPESCVFDHVHNKSVCVSSDSWNKSASDICATKGMQLQSYGMLQPCGLDVFSGVEFVCCPPATIEGASKRKTSDSSSSSGSGETGNSFAQAASALLPASMRDLKYDVDEQLNKINTDDDSSRKEHRSDNQNEHSDSNEDNDDDDDDEYGTEGEDADDDDGTSWNGERASSASSTSTTTTTTTTTTTEQPIHHYMSHFDLAHEHEEYRRAELLIDASYRDKITHVMREWSQLEGHYEEMKKKDSQAAEEFKRKMTHQFQKTVEALERESAAEKHKLSAMHAERAMAIINHRKKVAIDCLTRALDRIPINTRRVEHCIVKLLKALEKDRAHTLRQYKNLLNLSTRQALEEKKIILEHLITLNRAANQSIATLDRSPILVDKLKGKIVTLWHKLRKVKLDEPIVIESEERIMNQYEEEVAQRKIERERKKLAQMNAVQQHTETTTKSVAEGNKDANVKNEATGQDSNEQSASIEASQGFASKPAEAPEASTSATAQLQNQQVLLESSAFNLSSSRQAVEPSEKDRSHYQTDAVGFAHLRLETPYHELAYSVKHEPRVLMDGHMRFGTSTLLLSSMAALALLAFVGVMKYYGKSSSRAYRRQGFAEVGRTCPEEKSVTHMQFNGYENPAYKFFEAEA